MNLDFKLECLPFPRALADRIPSVAKFENFLLQTSDYFSLGNQCIAPFCIGTPPQSKLIRAQDPNGPRVGANCNPSDGYTAPCTTGTSTEAGKISKDTPRLLLCAQLGDSNGVLSIGLPSHGNAERATARGTYDSTIEPNSCRSRSCFIWLEGECGSSELVAACKTKKDRGPKADLAGRGDEDESRFGYLGVGMYRRVGRGGKEDDLRRIGLALTRWRCGEDVSSWWARGRALEENERRFGCETVMYSRYASTRSRNDYWRSKHNWLCDHNRQNMIRPRRL